ncbi:MAG: 3-dehydroquinate synthase family protein [Phycisphaerales bacterium]
MSERSVDVDLSTRSYEVRVGRGALGGVAAAARTLLGNKAGKALIVRDTGVPDRFEQSLIDDLRREGFETRVYAITPSESIKNIETVENLLIDAVRFGMTRVDVVVAIGGGVVGDIAGYVAASYQRGVAVVQCPSTLLSMVDASVGGKTGVNLSVDGALYKNMVGAFHQPTLVVAGTELLDSLDDRQRRCGLAECVKHAMICRSVPDDDGENEGLLAWMTEHLDEIAAFEASTIDELVGRNVALKAGVVMGDERESPDAKRGGRMLLNFGHTFGHAIETLEGISPTADPSDAPLHHGEAVALGMCAACATAESIGMCDRSVREGLVSMLDRIGLPTSVGGLPDSEVILARMGRDKKAAGGALRVILPTGRGECSIESSVPDNALGAGIDSIRA